MQTYERNLAALLAACETAKRELDGLSAELDAARQEKTALARQLTAAQEELRRMGLLSARRGAKKAEIARLTEQYTAAGKQVTALQSRQEEAKAQCSILQSRLALAKRTESSAPAPERPKAAPRPAPDDVDALLTRLEAWYPEHQVYALDSLCGDLRAKLSSLARKTGYASVAALLEAHGWRCIRGEAVLALRKGKHCVPGEEPEVIRPQVESMLTRLGACYPDRVIPRSIQRDHKSLSQDVTGLYQWLGYGSPAEMLGAYGYAYRASAGGRPATDAEALVEALRGACAEAEKPVSTRQLMEMHPAYAAALKTLQNRAPALFGMPLRQYLMEQGILRGRK